MDIIVVVVAIYMFCQIYYQIEYILFLKNKVNLKLLYLIKNMS